MTDHADIASQFEADRIARGLASISAAAPVGAPGECSECGEQMPRLVGGRCGFCRDGRRPPLSFYDARPALLPVAASPVQQEETTMTQLNTADKHTISVPAEGKVLDAIRTIAARDDLPLGRAAIALIDDAIALLPQFNGGVVEPDATDHQFCLGADLREASAETLHSAIEEMLGELARRADTSVDATDYDAAVARAEAAEAKLATLRAALAA